MNEQLAAELTAAIKLLASKPDNLDNFESYITHCFDTWVIKYANTPEGLTAEIKSFATMEV